MTSRIDLDKIDYVMMAISEFARHFGMPRKEAAVYLSTYKGIDFLDEHYDAEHTLSFRDCVSDLATVCRNNGGTLA